MNGEEVNRLTVFYYGEAERCKNGGAYFAGVVTLGAAMEVAIFSICRSFRDRITTEHLAPLKRNGQPKPIREWTLSDMLRAAKDMGWLRGQHGSNEDFDPELRQVGDYAEAIRQLCNLISCLRIFFNRLSSGIGPQLVDELIVTSLQRVAYAVTSPGYLGYANFSSRLSYIWLDTLTKEHGACYRIILRQYSTSFTK